MAYKMSAGRYSRLEATVGTNPALHRGCFVSSCGADLAKEAQLSDRKSSREERREYAGRCRPVHVWK